MRLFLTINSSLTVTLYLSCVFIGQKDKLKIMENITNNILYPSIPNRVKASLIDSVVLLTSAVLIMTIYFFIGIESPIIALVVSSVFLLYEPLFVSIKGQTLGHQLMHFKVVDKHSISHISFSKAIVRYLIKFILGMFSLGWAFFTNRQQSLHDLITKSVVVSVDIPLESYKSTGLPELPYASSQDDWILPTRKRRVVFSIVWYAVSFFFLSFIYGIFAPPECLEDGNSINYCNRIEIILGYAVIGALVVCLILGSKGFLPGARKKIGSQQTDAPDSNRLQ